MPTLPDWMAYIDAEVAATCTERGWGRQIRRKWTVRDKPVSQSTLDDYEWKLITHGQGRQDAPSRGLPDVVAGKDFEDGTYFVLGFDTIHGRFVLQHDTDHCGDFGDHRLCATYTEIALPLLTLKREPIAARYPDTLPPPGWLRQLLSTLTARFQPNHFSVT